MFPLILAMLLALASWGLVGAQPPAVLVVTVRDQAGDALSGITVTILDRSGQHVLSRGVTDAQGEVQVDRLPTESVRVVVAGATAGGVPLVLLGDDARGIALELAAPPTRLELRVERDGQVRPDPATMILPELGAPLLAEDAAGFPTAPRAAPTTLSEVMPATPIPDLPPESPPASPATWWLGLALLALLIIAITVIVWLRARRSSS